MNDNVKVVRVNEPTTAPRTKDPRREHQERKDPKPAHRDRVVIDTRAWSRGVADPGLDLANPEVQLKCVQELRDVPDSSAAWIPVLRSHLQQKIAGYKYQDVLKTRWTPQGFVDLDDVLTLLCDCHLACFYCHAPTSVLYKEVRDPRQWTLERINNDLGHVRGNVQIACLTCNLRRRTLYHERYILTKQMVKVNKLA